MAGTHLYLNSRTDYKYLRAQLTQGPSPSRHPIQRIGKYQELSQLQTILLH